MNDVFIVRLNNPKHGWLPMIRGPSDPYVFASEQDAWLLLMMVFPATLQSQFDQKCEEQFRVERLAPSLFRQLFNKDPVPELPGLLVH